VQTYNVTSNYDNYYYNNNNRFALITTTRHCYGFMTKSKTDVEHTYIPGKTSSVPTSDLRWFYAK